MAQKPQLGVGGWVQYNPSFDSPRAKSASGPEQTIGLVRQAFMSEGQQWYQVVWNPGDMNPKQGLYKAEQLTPLDNQEAQKILNQLSVGTYQSNLPQQSSQYVNPAPPVPALPPSQQPIGMYSR